MLSRLRDIDVQSHMSDESDYDYINRTPFEFDHFLDLSSDESLEPAYPSSSDIDPERPDMTRRPVMTFGDPRLGEPDQPRTLTGDEDIDDINAFLDDEIPQRFINYYQTAYKRTYPECCDEDTDAPWDHIDPEDPNDLEELYSRFVHFLTWLLETMYNEHCGSTDANAGMLEDWMDLSFQMAKHEIQKAGKNILPLIRDDVWENYKCLYMRLDDWVQQQIVEHDLWQSPHPSPRLRTLASPARSRPLDSKRALDLLQLWSHHVHLWSRHSSLIFTSPLQSPAVLQLAVTLSLSLHS